MTRLVLFELFVTNVYCLSTNKKLLVLADSFLDPMAQWLKEGCRKPVLGV